MRNKRQGVTLRNKYETCGKITKIFINRRNGEKLFTVIDTVNLPDVLNLGSLCAIKGHSNSYYVVYRNSDKQTSYLHRFLTNANHGSIVDHINHDTLNNCVSNLRIVNNSENLLNRKGAQINSKTGIRGVHWNNTCKRWRARLKINGQIIFSRDFSDIEEAQNAIREIRGKYVNISL